MKTHNKAEILKSPLLGGFSIGHHAVNRITQLFGGQTLLELGSGRGSQLLAQYFTLYSIEDQEQFVEKYKGGTVFHVPIKEGWYDTQILSQSIANLDYQFLLVDGPYGQNRMGIYENFGLFKKVPFLLDDTHRPQGKELVKLFEKDGYKFEFINEKDKQSALCLNPI